MNNTTLIIIVVSIITLIVAISIYSNNSASSDDANDKTPDNTDVNNDKQDDKTPDSTDVNNYKQDDKTPDNTDVNNDKQDDKTPDNSSSNDIIIIPECPSNGDWYETKSGETATLSCPIGYSGSRTRLCKDGTWQDEINTCTKNTCSAEGDWPETKSGETATLSCPIGYSGSKTRYCFSNGEWSDKIDGKCEVIKSQSSSSNVCPPTGSWPETETGKSVSISCPAGYTGSLTRKCNNDQQWDPTATGTCTPITCPTDDNYPQTLSGTTVTKSCPYGYSGSLTRYCNNGEWQDEKGSCTINKCPALERINMPMSSFDAIPETNAGETVYLECSEGQTGREYITCNMDGEWSMPINNCKAITCPRYYIWPDTQAGETVNITCPNGGTISKKCNEDGTWADTINNCASKTIDKDDDIFYCPAYDIWPETRGGNTSTIKCPDGYVGNIRKYCDKTGQWNTQIFGGCVKEDTVKTYCPADGSWPATVVNNTVSIVAPNDTITYTRYCNANGKWSNEEKEQQSTITSYCPADGDWPKTPANNQTAAVLKCPAGYIGYRQRYCYDDKTWSNEINKCIKDTGVTHCPATLKYPKTPVNTVYSFPCDRTYVQNQGAGFSALCNYNGEWLREEDTNINDNCIGNKCPADDDWPSIDYREISSTKRDCPYGFEGSRSRTCNEDGTWNHITDNCVKTTCPATDTLPKTYHGDTVELPCDNGQVGKKVYTCDNGSWKEELKCVDINTL